MGGYGDREAARAEGIHVPTSGEATTINRSAKDFWACLVDIDNVPVYERQVNRIEQIIDGHIGVGALWEGSTKVRGRNLDRKSECVACEPTSMYALGTTEARFLFTIIWNLVPEGEGSKVNHRLQSESGLGEPRGATRGGCLT
jgi:hypothetical protein